MKYCLYAVAACAVPAGYAHPALAAPGDPVKVSETLTIDPIIAGRLRYESVDQENPLANAEAVTLRMRAGAEVRLSNLSLLAEGVGTLAIKDNYNDTNSANGVEPYSVIADPQNVALNRLQMRYKSDAATFTAGRQRINLDDQRWVGAVGWRQNEQTFDAVRAETSIGPVRLDGTYAISQRTIFGIDAGPRQSLDGTFFFVGAGVKAGPVKMKGFAYLLDYDEAFVLANSSQTYGVRASAAFPLSDKAKLSIAASYARQSDYGSNPFDYAADYIAGEAGASIDGFAIKAGYELLGSDNGRAMRTPLATLHKFNGWADTFLTTPAAGLQDIYGGASYTFAKGKALPGLKAAITYHQFDSDVGGIDYGNEWDALIGFKIGRVGLLAKYANYNAKGFGVDTKKFWLQAQFAY